MILYSVEVLISFFPVNLKKNIELVPKELKL